MPRTAALLLLAALGCAHHSPPPVAAPPPEPEVAPPPAADALTLRRTACSGHCPVYTLTLTRTGAATFLGEQDVGTPGLQRWRVDPLFAGYLFSELERSGFLGLQPRYPTEVEEFPGLVLTYAPAAGPPHRVQLGGEGTEELPRNLEAERLLGRLALTFDKLAGTARFVQTGPRAAGGACTD